MRAPPELAVVFVSGNWVEAWTLACALEGYGIPPLLLDDGLCRLAPSYALLLGGVTVLLARTGLEPSLEIVELAFPGGEPHVGSFCSVPLSLWALLGAWLLRWTSAPRAHRDACTTL